MKHTKGPWIITEEGFISQECEETNLIASPHCSKNIDEDEREANAKLIAAAPELLEALKKALPYVSEFPNTKENNQIMELIESTISKAETL